MFVKNIPYRLDYEIHEKIYFHLFIARETTDRHWIYSLATRHSLWRHPRTSVSRIHSSRFKNGGACYKGNRKLFRNCETNLVRVFRYGIAMVWHGYVYNSSLNSKNAWKWLYFTLIPFCSFGLLIPNRYRSDEIPRVCRGY